ncbi:MAG: hypothetical protein FJ246_11315, partial [Nitrospira sp.]|nr:hypothetical protein [Nitrospira sp.]
MDTRVMRGLRRMYGLGRWAAMILLIVGSEGCSTALKPLPTVEVAPSLPSFDAVGVRDLIPEGLSIHMDGPPGYQAQAAATSQAPDRTIDQLLAQSTVAIDSPTVCSEDRLAPEICAEDDSAVKASESADPPVLAQAPAIKVEGPGELFRGPEPMEDGSYDPFQK